MITRRDLLETAGGALAFGSGGALTAPARGAEFNKQRSPLALALAAGGNAVGSSFSTLCPAKSP